MPSSSNRSTRSSGKRNVYDIEEDEEDELVPATLKTAKTRPETVDELAGEEQSVVRTPKARPLRAAATPLVVEEITESPRNAPGSGQRRRLEPGHSQAQILSSVLQGAVAGTNPTPEPRKKGRRGEELQTVTQNKSTGSQRFKTTRHSSAADDLDELSPEQPHKHLEAEHFSEVDEEADGIEDLVTEARIRRKRKRKSMVVAENTDPQPEEDDELAEEVDKPTKSRKGKSKTSPATQRQPKKPKASASSSKGRSRDGIPIAVQRLTKPIMRGEDETEEDILNTDIPYAKRGGVNAVDVLAQVSEEVLGSILSTLEEGGSKAQEAKMRREYRTKLRAVEAFQEELRISLFELVRSLYSFHFHVLIILTRQQCLTPNTLSSNASATPKKRRSAFGKTSSVSVANASTWLCKWTK